MRYGKHEYWYEDHNEDRYRKKDFKTYEKTLKGPEVVPFHAEIITRKVQQDDPSQDHR